MRLLLHVCCANCAIYPLKVLREEGHQVTGYFDNPNIHPYLEYQKRLAAVREFALASELPMRYRADYDLETFLANVAAEPADRCSYCYRSRLEATALAAREQGFDGFSTSLLYSRYQRHAVIHSLGEELAARHDLTFYYADFRAGWNEGIRVSKELGLYRQQYCGCIYSEKERYWRPDGG